MFTLVSARKAFCVMLVDGDFFLPLQLTGLIHDTTSFSSICALSAVRAAL